MYLMISREYSRPGCQCHSVAGLKLNLPSQGAWVWDGTGRGVDDQCSTAGLIMTMYNWTDDKNANKHAPPPRHRASVAFLFDVLLRGDVSIEVFMHFWVVARWLVSVPCPQDYAPLDG